jgi:uncharacterized membrane protein
MTGAESTSNKQPPTLRLMREQSIHRMFELGVILKGLHALLELCTGVLILALSPTAVSNFFFALARRTWTYDSRDLLANFLVRSGLRILNGGQHFAAIYLLVHGFINMGLVIGLLANALWSYPVSVAAIALFMAYQLYRYAHTRATILILLTVYDAVVCWLVWHEYRLRRKSPAG